MKICFRREVVTSQSDTNVFLTSVRWQFRCRFLAKKRRTRPLRRNMTRVKRFFHLSGIARSVGENQGYKIPSATLFSPEPVKFATNLKILRISSVVIANFLLTGSQTQAWKTTCFSHIQRFQLNCQSTMFWQRIYFNQK